jgi:hypothetical protein
MKPLVPVNQKPLIVHATDLAGQVESGRTVVVAAPENAAMLSSVLPDHVQMILQREAAGPGHALLVGLKLTLAEEVLILMGDNLTPVVDVKRVVGTKGNVVGTGLVELEACERFTRRRRMAEDTWEWVEKIPVDTENDEAPDVSGFARCWLGPLKLRSREIRTALQVPTLQRSAGELPLGPALNFLEDVVTVDVHSVDIGLPEVLP